MHSYSKKYFSVLSLVAVAVSNGAFARGAFASDESVKKGLEEATASFARRSSVDPRPIDQALSVLQSVEGQADDSDLNYDVLILESRAYYWKGVHVVSNDDKMKIHDLGVKAAERARSSNGDYAEAYYYAGINLARWGEAKGVLASLSRKGELENYMNQSMSHATRDEQPGKSIDGNGADRVLGRMYFKLPGIFGGSHDKSVFHLKRAMAAAKNVALNVVYYAETLSSGNGQEKALAKQILDELLASDPQSLNANRIPETLDEFQLARKLRKEIE